jgi:hypothetical protein
MMASWSLCNTVSQYCSNSIHCTFREFIFKIFLKPIVFSGVFPLFSTERLYKYISRIPLPLISWLNIRPISDGIFNNYVGPDVILKLMSVWNSSDCLSVFFSLLPPPANCSIAIQDQQRKEVPAEADRKIGRLYRLYWCCACTQLHDVSKGRRKQEIITNSNP